MLYLDVGSRVILSKVRLWRILLKNRLRALDVSLLDAKGVENAESLVWETSAVEVELFAFRGLLAMAPS